MKIRFNEKVAEAVFSTLNNLWGEKGGIFKGVRLPQDIHLQTSDQVEQANWFFYGSIPMRGAVVSEDPFQWLAHLKGMYPEIFLPDVVSARWSPERIETAFKETTRKVTSGASSNGGTLGPNIGEHARAWFENSVKLSTYWGGNPLNIFWGVTEFEEAFRRVDYRRSPAGFIGMRRKIFSLFTIFLQEKGLIPTFPTPIPVDFHAMRVILATEIVSFKDVGKVFAAKEKHPAQLSGKLAIRVWENFPDAIATWSQGFIHAHGFRHLNINPAIWTLSRLLCAENFQNISRGGGSEYIDANKLEKNSHLWPKGYKNPCVHCPIESHCKWAIPAQPYYKWGLLVRMGRRVKYHAPFLTGVNWQEHMPFRSRKGRGMGKEG